jgi:restriction endonuclease S subunit
LWGIDGNFEFNVIPRGEKFRTTDHAGRIEILDQNIDPYYLYYYLGWIRSIQTLDRELRANLTNMKKIDISLPVKLNPDGTPKTRTTPQGDVYDLDLEAQKRIAEFYSAFEEVKKEIIAGTNQIAGLEFAPLTE